MCKNKGVMCKILNTGINKTERLSVPCVSEQGRPLISLNSSSRGFSKELFKRAHQKGFSKGLFKRGQGGAAQMHLRTWHEFPKIPVCPDSKGADEVPGRGRGGAEEGPGRGQGGARHMRSWT